MKQREWPSVTARKKHLGQTNLLARPLKFGKTIIVRLKTKLGT